MAKLPNDRAIRMLNELLQEPGNGICADCKNPNPRWTSHNLGIFICMACASIHRKLGVHISKVKSTNLDDWTKDQIDHMRVTGNLNSNAIFNPTNVEPPVNLHDAERDSELEKFVRNKYQYRKFMNLRSIGHGSKEQDAGRSAATHSDSKPQSSLTVAPPARTSSSPQPTRASPALTTKSPPPSTSPRPVPTPSPSIPVISSQAPLQMLAPSSQPPLQMLSPSPQPPLQMLSPSYMQTMQTGMPMGMMGMGMTSLQTGMVPGMTGSFQTPMFTATQATAVTMGGMVNPPQGMQALAAPGTVWSDMAAIQGGPNLSPYQYPVNTGIGLGPNVMPNTFTGMQGSYPIGTAPMGMTSMGGLVNTTYTGMAPMQTGYLQSTGFANPQASPYGQQMSPYGAQQQTQIISPQPQGYVVRDGQVQALTPSPGIPGGNPTMWTPGMPGMGYGMGTQNQWHA